MELLRRIPPYHLYEDKERGSLRPSSAAFEDDDDGDPMSVYRRDILQKESGGIQRVMIGHPNYALASLTAGHVRCKDQTVHPDPLPEESAHTQICGLKPKSTCRWFAKQAKWALAPSEHGQ